MAFDYPSARVRLHNPRQAAEYLRDTYGIVRAVPTLAKLRCIGGGPAFHKIGGKHIGYSERALDEFAARVLGPELHSTSEAT